MKRTKNDQLGLSVETLQLLLQPVPGEPALDVLEREVGRVVLEQVLLVAARGDVEREVQQLPPLLVALLPTLALLLRLLDPQQGLEAARADQLQPQSALPVLLQLDALLLYALDDDWLLAAEGLRVVGEI